MIKDDMNQDFTSSVPIQINPFLNAWSSQYSINKPDASPPIFYHDDDPDYLTEAHQEDLSELFEKARAFFMDGHLHAGETVQ